MYNDENQVLFMGNPICAYMKSKKNRKNHHNLRTVWPIIMSLVQWGILALSIFLAIIISIC